MIQFPRDSKDLLIFDPSLSLTPLLSAAEALSLPAKSTKYNLGVKNVVIFPLFAISISRESYIIACERELN